MMKQYFCISFVLYVIINISFVLTAQETYVNKASSNRTQTLANNTNSTGNATNVVLTEGGRIELPQKHQSREGVIISTSTTVSAIIERPNNATSTQKVSLTNLANDTTSSTTTSPSEEPDIKPVIESEKHEGSRVKPRKGVSLNDTVPEDAESKNSTTNLNILNSTVSTTITQKSTTPTVSTTTFIPIKPTVTIGSDEEDPPLRSSNVRVFDGGKEISPKNSSSSPTVIKGDPVVVGNRLYKKGSDYVLPIVLTILAVPLLAIIITVVYKRGAEWWNHRHYRRMDFLIDGMYNN